MSAMTRQVLRTERGICPSWRKILWLQNSKIGDKPLPDAEVLEVFCPGTHSSPGLTPLLKSKLICNFLLIYEEIIH